MTKTPSPTTSSSPSPGVKPTDYWADQPAHSVYSPSGASRWMGCTASIDLARRLKEIYPADVLDGESPYAAEGTSAHEFLEHCLRNNVHSDKTDEFIGQRFYKHEVDEEMVEAINKCLDEIDMVLTEWGLSLDYTESVLAEQKLGMWSLHPTDCFGTVDVTIIDAENCRFAILDLKYGKGVRVHLDTPQLKFYAIGVLDTFGWEKFEECYLGIMQPRIPESQQNTIDLGMPVPVWEIDEYRKEYAEIIENIEAGKTEYKPSEDACRWCKGSQMNECDRLDSHVMETLAEEFEGLPTEGLTLPEILDRIPLIRSWCDKQEQLALQKMKEGEEIPGFKMIRGMAFREWADVEQMIREVKDAVLSEDEMYTKKIISPAQFEKIVGRVAARDFAHLIETPLGKLKIDKESSNKREVTVYDLTEDDLA